MRTVVSWAWFRPSEKAWDEGARWYRCDVVGGGEQSKKFVDLPTTARGLLQGRPKDHWLVCVNGDVGGQSAPKIPCTEPHNWRAVTTIKLGEPEDPYPGDRLVEVTTRDFCSDSVRRLARLPARVRVRLHVVPRGRVEGRQPPLGLLGEDERVSRLVARRRGAPAALRWRAATARRRTPSRRPGHADDPPPPDRRSTAADRRPERLACHRLSYDEARRPDRHATAGRLRRAAHQPDLLRRRSSTPPSTGTCSPSTRTASRRRSPTPARRKLAASSAAPRSSCG